MLRAQANRLAILIPVHRPSERLLDLVRALSEKSFAHIVIVDDASGPDFEDTLAHAASLAGVTVLRHAVSLGRGAALKTGFNYALCAIPDLVGVITVAGDGQDHPDDIERVAESLLANPTSLVLGCHQSSGTAPLHSRLANAAAGTVMHALLGRKVEDWHGGLRAIPADFARRLLRLETNGSRFELETLIAAHQWGVALVEEPVRPAAEPSPIAEPAAESLKVYALPLKAVETLRRVAAPRPVKAWPRFTLPAGLAAELVMLVFLAALAVEAYGFGTARLFSQDIWAPIGVKRFLRYMGMYLGIAMPLLMMAPWSFAMLITGLTGLGTVLAIGPLAVIAVAFFLVSSCALGSRLLGPRHGDEPESQLFATLLGIAVWIFLMTLTARFPVHYALVWAVLLAIPIALDWRGAWRRLVVWGDLLRGAELRGAMERFAFAAVVFVLLAHWFVALMPEVSADGLAMHLAIPANIAANHAMTFQPSRFVWAVMPMGADFSYSIVYLLGGEYAAHLLDYALLLMLEAVIYYAMRRWVCRAAGFLLLALFASTPLVQLVTGSLFVENMLAVLIAGLMAAIWRFSETGEKRFLYLAAILGGTAMSTKFGALAFVALAIPFLAVEVVRHWRTLGPRPAAVCAIAALLLLSTALPPYAIAYAKTGNALFPFLADKIPSKFIPPNAGLVDERFKRPLTWETPFDLTFLTNKTYEGQNGSFGFQYLVLAPLGVAGLLLVRRRNAIVPVSAAVVALGAAAIIMGTQPNARYVYAALPLLSVPFAALLGWAAGMRWLYRSLLAFVVACICMNLRFMPSASYYHRDFSLRLPFSRAERDRYRAEAVPIREVIAYFNRAHPHAAVMLSSDASIAGLNADIYENHWHQINQLLSIRATKTVPEMVRLMQSWGVQYFISSKPGTGDEIKPEAFREMLERCTEAEFELGDEYLARLQPTCRPRQERAAVEVGPGFYDDFDPALVFRGDWTKDTGFEQPDRHTITFTDDARAEAQIVFQGKALTYCYTKARNRGMASVTIDGVEQGSVDLYSPTDEWQSRTRFCCFAPGRHVAVIRVTGTANPRSSGKFIDVDSFTVE